MDSLLRIFPQKRRAFWQKTADNGEKICEIRLRVDRPVIVETSRGDYFLNNGGEWQEHPYGAHLVTEAEIRELCNADQKNACYYNQQPIIHTLSYFVK